MTFTTQLRNQLPASDYIITHARECAARAAQTRLVLTWHLHQPSRLGACACTGALHCRTRKLNPSVAQVLAELLDQRRIHPGRLGGR